MHVLFMSKQKKCRTRFWENYSLKELNSNEWEALCDGCGKCCLRKIEDADTKEIFYTNVSCKLLDIKSARCRNYKDRKKIVPDCIILTPDNIKEIAYWMPETCGYRRVFYGEPLEHWHPLMTNNKNSAIKAGQTIANQVISEADVNEEDLEDYITTDFSEHH